ncbi:serine endopeptidase [Diplocarpon mali]|nr:serine endopeptidase [Diplocarpon mali]
MYPSFTDGLARFEQLTAARLNFEFEIELRMLHISKTYQNHEESMCIPGSRQCQRTSVLNEEIVSGAYIVTFEPAQVSSLDSVPSDILIQDFIMARNKGADIITSSIGSNNGCPEDPWSAATAAIVVLGTPCMLAAGISGTAGLFFAPSAASGTGDFTGKVALIRCGGCNFHVKITNAVAAGARYVLVYNDVAGLQTPSITNTAVVGAGLVPTDLGEQWIIDLAAGSTVKVSFVSSPVVVVQSPGSVNLVTGGKHELFSSYGLTAKNTIAPVVSAPGGLILSSYLASYGGYAVLSGTSMACPFVAGVVVLNLQAKGKKVSPKIINSVLSATAKPLNYNDETASFPFLASVTQQGAGLVDAYHMIHAQNALSEVNIALNDTANFVRNPSFYVENVGTTVATYQLTHEPATNVYGFNSTYGVDFNWAISAVPDTDQKYSGVIVAPVILTVAPGQKERVGISVTPDASLNRTHIPVYSGFIKVTSGTAETGLNIWEPFFSLGTTPFSGEGSVNGSIEVSKPSRYLYPYFYWSKVMATKQTRLDIVNVNGTNPATVLGLDTVGWLGGYTNSYFPPNVAGSYF